MQLETGELTGFWQEGNVDDDDSDGYKVIMISLTMLLSSISASYHASLPGDCFVPRTILARITLGLKVHLCLCFKIIYFISGHIVKWLEFPGECSEQRSPVLSVIHCLLFV